MEYHQAKKALAAIFKWGGSGDEKEVKKILDEHPSLINEFLDSYGWTVLVLASKYNNLNVIKLLLSYSQLEINIEDNDGWTALHYASYNDHPDIVESLLSHHNIDVNRLTKDGSTALHFASEKGHKEVVEVLLSHNNIDLNTQNKDWKVASEVCCDWSSANKSNKPIILEFLENHRTRKVIAKENESLKLQIQVLEERMREMTNNMINEMENNDTVMERRLQEKDNNFLEIDKRLQEKDKECAELRDRIIKMEERFEVWMKQMDGSNKDH
mmetsp:Transcript_30090/g.32797  ORF Transcript_30090/g.32797 Transcript_30090/m.32797 type:complete len:270 (+) Transcript_30090:89-898(+)